MNFFADEQAAELRECFFESAEEILQAMNDAGLQSRRASGRRGIASAMCGGPSIR